MPAILDAPEVLDYEAHDLSEAQPRLRPARAGFWHTLVQYLRRQSVHRDAIRRPPIARCTRVRRQQTCWHASTRCSISRPMLVYESLADIHMLPGSPDTCMDLLGHTQAARCHHGHSPGWPWLCP